MIATGLLCKEKHCQTSDTSPKACHAKNSNGLVSGASQMHYFAKVSTGEIHNMKDCFARQKHWPSFRHHHKSDSSQRTALTKDHKCAASKRTALAKFRGSSQEGRFANKSTGHFSGSSLEDCSLPSIALVRFRGHHKRRTLKGPRLKT